MPSRRSQRGKARSARSCAAAAAVLCLGVALRAPGDEPPAAPAPSDTRVVVGTQRAPPPPRTEETMHLQIYPGWQQAPAGPGPAPAAPPAPAGANPVPPATPAPGTPGGIPLGIGVGMTLANCPDGNREVSALDLGGWAIALQPACVDRAARGRFGVYRSAPATGGAPPPPAACDPARWTCSTSR